MSDHPGIVISYPRQSLGRLFDVLQENDAQVVDQNFQQSSISENSGQRVYSIRQGRDEISIVVDEESAAFGLILLTLDAPLVARNVDLLNLILRQILDSGGSIGIHEDRRCQNCGYSLLGNQSRRCPECGKETWD